ncbi:hypothetical protein [Halosimplex sp. J119]
MEQNEPLEDRGRLARVGLAAVLAVVAVRSFLKRKPARGALAGLGAAALGYTATSESTDVIEEFGPEPIATDEGEDDQLRCASCGEPIVAGQRRKPNEDGETVHESCLEASA